MPAWCAASDEMIAVNIKRISFWMLRYSTPVLIKMSHGHLFVEQVLLRSAAAEWFLCILSQNKPHYVDSILSSSFTLISLKVSTNQYFPTIGWSSSPKIFHRASATMLVGLWFRRPCYAVTCPFTTTNIYLSHDYILHFTCRSIIALLYAAKEPNGKCLMAKKLSYRRQTVRRFIWW